MDPEAEFSGGGGAAMGKAGPHCAANTGAPERTIVTAVAPLSVDACRASVPVLYLHLCRQEVERTRAVDPRPWAGRKAFAPKDARLPAPLLPLLVYGARGCVYDFCQSTLRLLLVIELPCSTSAQASPPTPRLANDTSALT